MKPAAVISLQLNCKDLTALTFHAT